jgi:hypothetical protein
MPVVYCRYFRELISTAAVLLATNRSFSFPHFSFSLETFVLFQKLSPDYLGIYVFGSATSCSICLLFIGFVMAAHIQLANIFIFQPFRYRVSFVSHIQHHRHLTSYLSTRR